ncbi:MAG: MiaB/RimO family radical SAM methylthiotransferase, partial [Ruminiclostridium sp.]|nr:MiaB/RimO family radical SAM methylthiotransferase [Ruminiclostridium sp.]
MEYAIHTFGGKVNQYESAVISRGMTEMGFIKTEDIRKAEVVVINSCSVTEQSDKKACQLIRKLKSGNPQCIVALCGCFPQAFKCEAEKSGADIIIGTENKNKLPEIIYDYVNNSQKDIYCNVSELGDRLCFKNMPFSDMGKTRAFIKIEDGCDRYCSYCIIPYARGKVRSRAIEDIIEETKFQVGCGHKEIVAVGINLSLYGSDIGLRLADAVHAICSVDGVERVRLSSLEPELISEADIERLSRETKLCPHFHLALQSGCEATLKRMNRHYTPDEYYEIVENLRRYFPDCS